MLKHKRNHYHILYINLLFPLILSHFLSAQEYITLSGRIFDAGAEPVSNAQIILNPGTYQVFSDETGHFNLDKLQSGTYSLTVYHVNFNTFHMSELMILKSLTLGDIELTPAIFETGKTVVTATRKGIDQTLLIEPLNMITDLTIAERVSKETPELLREETGIFVQKTNHGGGSPVIRGLNSNRILMLVDGIRLNNATYRLGNHQYLTTIDNFSLASLEVIRGPGSVLYGSDAVGGVINTVTYEPSFSDKSQWDLKISAIGESADQSFRGNARFSFVSPRIFVTAGLSYKKFNDLRRGTQASSPQLEKSPSGAKQSPTAYNANSIDVKAGFRIAEDKKLIIAFQNSRQFDVPRYDKYENEDYYRWTYEPQERNLFYTKYASRFKNSLFQEMNLNFSYHLQEEARNIQRFIDSDLDVEMDAVHTAGFSTKISGAYLKNHYAIGLDVYYDLIRSRKEIYDNSGTVIADGIRGLYPDNAGYLSTGIFANDVFSINKEWLIDGGIRYSLFKSSITDSLAISGSSRDGGNVENIYHSFIFNLGTKYSIDENFSVRGGVRQGFRAPNLSDMAKLGQSKGTTYEIPNPDIEPEKIFTYDVGLEFQNGFAGFGLDLYFSQMSDLISSAPSSINGDSTIIIDGEEFLLRSKQNIGSGNIYGVEGYFGVQFNRSLRVSGNLTWTYGENSTRDEPMGGIPPIFGRVGLRWQRHSSFFDLFTRFASKQDRLSEDDLTDPRIPVGGTPGWFTLNLRLGSRILKNLDLSLGIENILDHNYREHGSGLNGPGRNFSARIIYAVGPY